MALSLSKVHILVESIAKKLILTFYIIDFHHIDLIAHFDRERIPERVVHAKGAGAHGTFEVTHDISDLTCAKLFSKVGNKAKATLRFSTVGGESGSADTARDPRGFAIKLRTEDGNLDWVFNNTPVFFIRDPSKFPHFIHTQKRDPQTHLKDADMFWVCHFDCCYSVLEIHASLIFRITFLRTQSQYIRS